MRSLKIRILEKSENAIRFILEGASVPFANALRRTMIAEVPCMAIDEVTIIENSSLMEDEVLAHRLGLIPLMTELKSYVLPSKCKCGSELGCNLCRVILRLEAEAIDKPMTVYSSELRSDDPKVVPASPNIEIVKLGTGQKIKIEAYARLGLGKDHAKWQPVSACAYKYMPKIAVEVEKCDLCGKCVRICPRKILSMEAGKLEVTDLLACTLCRDCVKECPTSAINVSWDDATFIFKVESTGTLPVDQIIEEAAKVLKNKADEFIELITGLSEHGQET